jgi:hypothetical protein
MVPDHTTEPDLLEPKMLFDHTKWMRNLGPNASLLQAEACG